MKPDYETLVSQTILLPTNKTRADLPRLSRLKEKLELYQRHYETRRQLRSLSPEQLQDIGITAEQAEVESKKIFWKS